MDWTKSIVVEESTGEHELKELVESDDYSNSDID